MEQSASVLSEPEQIGGFGMTVELGEESPESTERWEQRANVLADWLLAEWRREHAEVTDV